ncbi:hypothetical protein GCM10023149_21110 [Mucilaginibacter gynuensis]|uniref:Cysteine peptidase C11 family protein n=1 Tax=Mucilaginibacter gynuensis TaxID=1302236 RepID=A0ABP8GBS8_9SPHI
MENAIVPQNKKWLIIFLIYADFTTNNDPDQVEKLKVTLNNMLGDIITTPVNAGRTRILVVMNSIKFVFDNAQTAINDKSAFYTIGICKDVTQNCITKCDIIDNFTCYKTDNSDGHVLQKSHQLTKIFTERTALQDDEEVFLITWDHGSAFGIFRDEPPLPNAGTVAMQVEKNLMQYPFLKTFWDAADESYRNNLLTAVGNNEENQALNISMPTPGVPEILKNSELNEALQAWLRNKRKVGVLLMTNCWMMNLHTMYALKESVRCLVAPQGNIDCPGYNIKDILIGINRADQTGIEPVKLAELCVTTIDNEYSKAKAAILDKSEPDVIERFKIFAVDLSKETGGENIFDKQIDDLEEIFQILVDDLKAPDTNTDLKYFLKYIRSVCFDFSDDQTQMIDIVNWLKSLIRANIRLDAKMLTDSARKKINAFLMAMLNLNNNIVLKSSSGKKIYVIERSIKLSPTVGLPPAAYSLFFPMIYRPGNPNLQKLKDNVVTDGLMSRLKSWQDLLGFIDPQISNFFV